MEPMPEWIRSRLTYPLGVLSHVIHRPPPHPPRRIILVGTEEDRAALLNRFGVPWLRIYARPPPAVLRSQSYRFVELPWQHLSCKLNGLNGAPLRGPYFIGAMWPLPDGKPPVDPAGQGGAIYLPVWCGVREVKDMDLDVIRDFWTGADLDLQGETPDTPEPPDLEQKKAPGD